MKPFFTKCPLSLVQIKRCVIILEGMERHSDEIISVDFKIINKSLNMLIACSIQRPIDPIRYSFYRWNEGLSIWELISIGYDKKGNLYDELRNVAR